MTESDGTAEAKAIIVSTWFTLAVCGGLVYWLYHLPAVHDTTVVMDPVFIEADQCPVELP